MFQRKKIDDIKYRISRLKSVISVRETGMNEKIMLTNKVFDELKL